MQRLKISPYNNQGQELAAIAISDAAEVRDHPADLINVAIRHLQNSNILW